jgi:branched-chain amino acid transport system permease protein
VLSNSAGVSKFVQGLAIEVFIFALYALSYDLIFGITGLLSFGHAMFFAVGAYLTGALIKSFGLPLWQTLLWVTAAVLAGAALWHRAAAGQGDHLCPGDAGHGVGLSHHDHVAGVGRVHRRGRGLAGHGQARLPQPGDGAAALYYVALALLVVMYYLFKRFVDSPTGRVCVAIRENEGRALMLGYNTFIFKLAALLLSSFTAALAGSLYAIYQPIISPHIASLGFTVTALLIILIGGVGTLQGALVGALVYRLLDFGLRRYMGESASFVNGVIYVLIVIFLPYGIVGTWRMQSYQLKQGWASRRTSCRRRCARRRDGRQRR